MHSPGRAQCRRVGAWQLSYGTNLARMVEEVASDLEKARGLQRKRKLQFQLLENEKMKKAEPPAGDPPACSDLQ